jgi:pyridoxine 5-phosphate synthase
MHVTPRLSVNVNKVATLRNSRGGEVPRVLDAVAVCVRAGAAGITVHPRADARHITADDVRAIAQALHGIRPGVEFNIEGDPRPDLMDLVLDVGPDQCTLVPVVPGEITSQKGWVDGPDAGHLSAAVSRLRARGIRVSLFVEPDAAAIRFASSVGADRVELYTEPFARAFERGQFEALDSFERFVSAAHHAHALGLGVNAGHDLDLQNLVLFRRLPHLQEVSIGHAIVARALFLGLETVVREYLAALSGTSEASAPPAREVD